MLFAEISQGEGWILGCTIVMALAAIAAVIIALVALRSRTNTLISPQPLSVEVVKALHEQFANKDEFDGHVTHNTERHGQLFNRIDAAERKAREEMERRFTTLAEDRRHTLDKLNTEFVFIRENIAAINRELKIRNE